MTRFETIVRDAEDAAKVLPYNERQSFLCGWFKAEIRHLCREIDPGDIEEDKQYEPEICPACSGCGEYRTERGWWPCEWCKGKGVI